MMKYPNDEISDRHTEFCTAPGRQLCVRGQDRPDSSVGQSEKPLPMIYQSGYLTIKDYNRRFGTFLLDYPNNEVKKGFVSLVASDSSQTGTAEEWKIG